MIYRNSVKYNQNKKGTSLSARFGYAKEVKEDGLSKEDILRRLDIGNNNEFKDYLKNVEGLELASLYFFNKDDKGFERHGGIYPNKNNLRFRIDVLSKQRVSKENMLHLPNLDIFLSKGISP